MERCLHEISDAKRGYSNLAEKEMENLCSHLEDVGIDEVLKFGLLECLDDLQTRINVTSNTIYEQHFKIQFTRISTSAMVQDLKITLKNYFENSETLSSVGVTAHNRLALHVNVRCKSTELIGIRLWNSNPADSILDEK